ncbi:MAG: PHP domain-containing protein [Candidatus Aminicenantes bacterium]|nr:PHP domain-containing protein [Candidatus Aminicenantes bacterium]
MKSGCVDLHIHSDRSSDGDYSPEAIARMAAEAGFAAIAIADHDTVAAYPAALEAGRKEGVEIVPSMEVTTMYDDREFHCQLPFLDWENARVAGIVERVAETRWQEARERVVNLRALGVGISWEEVEAASPEMAPLGVTIARILLDKPESRRDPKLRKYYGDDGRPFPPSLFYRDFFLDGAPAYVPKRHIALLEVLEESARVGAAAVLSHPGAYFQKTTHEDLDRLKDFGLAGLEVYTSYHDAEQTRFYLEEARTFDLVPTAGSDFHGRVKPHVAFGSIKDGGYEMVEALRERRPSP